MFIAQQPQYMYPGAQGGMVCIQPSGAMTVMPQGYPAAGQQAVFVPSSQVTFMELSYSGCKSFLTIKVAIKQKERNIYM